MNWDVAAKIFVGFLGFCGVVLSVYFGYKQFKIKRDDEQEALLTQKKIDDAITKTKVEIYEKLNEVSIAKSKENERRFNAHEETFKQVDKRIEENTKQIGELAGITKNVLNSMDSMHKTISAAAKSSRNSNYDRLLFVTNKILKSKKMTISDLTNLKQLYQSWKELEGEDPEMDTMYEECLKIQPTLDEETINAI